MAVDYKRAGHWVMGFILFIMVVAAWSRVSKMKESPKLITGISNSITNLFKGVFK